MSDGSAAAFGPVAAYAMIVLFRALLSRATPFRPAQSPVKAAPQPRRVVPPPTAVDNLPLSKVTLQAKWPVPHTPLVVPVERWRRTGELLAWRCWKLGRLRSDGGIRLLSLSAPAAWDGPVLGAHRMPSESPFSASGVYALKALPPRRANMHWSPDCWVSGWVALSGRVVEHERGYRAERAVIRRLRLGIGTHLNVAHLEDLLALAAELEQRYQAPVNLGLVERRFAARSLNQDDRRGIPEIPQGVRIG